MNGWRVQGEGEEEMGSNIYNAEGRTRFKGNTSKFMLPTTSWSGQGGASLQLHRACSPACFGGELTPPRSVRHLTSSILLLRGFHAFHGA